MEVQSLDFNGVRLHLKDLNSGLTFLVDTGADVSGVPRPKDWDDKPLDFTLYAANRTPIKTYNVEKFTVKFTEDKSFNWPFYIADVLYHI